MRSLPDVTLIAFGSTNLEGMKKALDYSCKGIKFGDVKLITEVECRTIDEWNHHIIFTLGKFVDTPLALLVHPDGFVVHPESWRNEWLDYDFIGSPWPLPSDDYSYRTPDGEIVRVGNSVSLRSKRILDLPKRLNLEWKEYFGNTNEDGFITCHNRRILQHCGCKFAPFEEAVLFGREIPLPENKGVKPFVFHKHEGENAVYPNFEKE